MNVPETRRLTLSGLLCLLLAALLVIPPGLAAQSAASPPQALPVPVAPMATLPMVRSLKISALAGHLEMNDLERGLMAPLVVEVRDRNDRAIEGADVVFRFPPNGPGATFPEGKYSRKVRSNSQGQAVAVG